MDVETLRAYDQDAAAFAEDWHTQPAPTDLHELVRRYFTPGATADIGCGAGRDTAWLTDNGFPAVGYDPSDGLLAEARRRHPGISFIPGALPELAGIAEGSLINVLCETVIMHLEPDAVVPAVGRLAAILAPTGTLYLTWRVSTGADRRDDHGRRYAAFDAGLVVDALSGLDLLVDDEVTSASSARTIHRIIARKP